MSGHDPRWKTRDGRVISVKDMETSHVQRALAMLKRKGFVGPSTVLAYLSGPVPQGEHAQDAFNAEFAEITTRPMNPFVDIFENELKRRGVAQ